jgi:hypothetical protein
MIKRCPAPQTMTCSDTGEEVVVEEEERGGGGRGKTANAREEQEEGELGDPVARRGGLVLR